MYDREAEASICHEHWGGPKLPSLSFPYLSLSLPSPFPLPLPPLEKYWGGPAPLGPPRIDASAVKYYKCKKNCNLSTTYNGEMAGNCLFRAKFLGFWG